MKGHVTRAEESIHIRQDTQLTDPNVSPDLFSRDAPVKYASVFFFFMEPNKAGTEMQKKYGAKSRTKVL